VTGVLAERPYRIAVRAKNAEGASPDVFSEPFVVEDDVLPSFVADAQGFPKSLMLNITASDNLALDHWVLALHDDSAGEEGSFIVGEGLLDGLEGHVSWAATIPASLWGKEIRGTADVFDSAGNATRRFFAGSVDENGLFMLANGPAVSEPGPDTKPLPVPRFGGCAASGRSPSDASLFLGLVLAASLVRRARRR